MTTSEHIQPHHLQRHAVVYPRQSTPQQVLNHQESLRLQMCLPNVRAHSAGMLPMFKSLMTTWGSLAAAPLVVPVSKNSCHVSTSGR